MIYLASPYSHPDPRVRQERYEAAVAYAAAMWREGRTVFSPIAHSHPIALLMPEGGGTWEQWAEFDRIIIEACSSIWVLMLPGWRESKGVAAEVKIAHEIVKSVTYVELPSRAVGK